MSNLANISSSSTSRAVPGRDEATAESHRLGGVGQDSMNAQPLIILPPVLVSPRRGMLRPMGRSADDSSDAAIETDV